ncbi:hypothetical protein O1611_g8379 [Lasiodiplodia mahajangana]|uniref:Uncharacterized protein n=1 Tax=Lasiodiplodia mahajangana TaxID=1108764 RepID=A0ACC2JCU4_9PEZI|nr:hypothetical protein O1611_g8379 [Lasiodiplodia mahajangana]
MNKGKDNRDNLPSHPSPNFNFAAERGFSASRFPCPNIDHEFLYPYVKKCHRLFRQIISELASLDGNDSLAGQWGVAKKNAQTMPEDYEAPPFSRELRDAYHFYKEYSELVRPLCDKFNEAKTNYDNAYREACKSSKNTTVDQRTLADLRSEYLNTAEEWFKISLEAAQRRLDFMIKYPEACNRPDTFGHLGAVKYDMKQAGDACAGILRYKTREQRRLTKHGEGGTKQ